MHKMRPYTVLGDNSFWKKIEWRRRNRWWRTPVAYMCLWCLNHNWNKLGKFLNKLQLGHYRRK